jgi:hypothetical protein
MSSRLGGMISGLDYDHHPTHCFRFGSSSNGAADWPRTNGSNTPAALFAGTVGRVLSMLQPATNGPTATLTTTLKVAVS